MKLEGMNWPPDQIANLQRLVHQVEGCSMIFDKSVPRTVASASAWLPWLYDTVVIVLVLRQSWAHMKFPGGMKVGVSIYEILRRDGLLYYS